MKGAVSSIFLLSLCRHTHADSSSDDFARGGDIVPYTLPWWHPEIQHVSVNRVSIRLEYIVVQIDVYHFNVDALDYIIISHLNDLHHIKHYRFLDQVIILNWIMIQSFKLLLGRILERVIDFLMDGEGLSNAHGGFLEDILIVMITLSTKVSVYSMIPSIV